jgi:outer membrane receptor for ferrienterochelin and colicins
MRLPTFVYPCAIAAALGLCNLAVHAQATEPSTTSTPDSKPNDKADKPEERKAAQPRIEVTGQRDAVNERRNSTAAKIIITREDIEQYGDTNLGDVMRRLPGVSQGGRPGRGGSPRMRGMGGGYTQILINGERSPPGFSIENISPDQVERIEILRAPTAETGARAVAGTINIILREPLRSTSQELKAGVQAERARMSPNLSYTHNDTLGETGSYNFTLSLNRNNTLTDTDMSTQRVDALTGQTLLAQDTFSAADNLRDSVFASSRLQWRLSQPGETFSLQPFVVFNKNHSQTNEQVSTLAGTGLYDNRLSTNDTDYQVMRLNAQLMKRLDPQTRLELRGNAGQFSLSGHTATTLLGSTPSLQTSTQDISDKSWNVAAKLMRNLESGHSLTAGAEHERVNRVDSSISAVSQADLEGDLKASTRRNALYVQDEWDIVENWSANLGLRWESIATRSDGAGTAALSNTSNVLSPIGHLVWRFASPRKDQLRLSLTQSYKPPTTQNLVSRPSLNTKEPAPGANSAFNADRAGNAALKPELAQGVDLAYESFLSSGGIVSVSFFQRNVSDLIRNVTALQTVSWATSPRYVSRPQNVGDAITRGIEFDAKFRLTELLTDAPPVNMKANVSIYRSSVKDIQGPYNRIDEQPSASGNIGADYRIPSTPFTLGINYALTAGYTTQISNDQSSYTGAKRVIDVYTQWAVSPGTRLRLSLSNLAARDSLSSTQLISNGVIDSSQSVGRTDVSASLRLEMRL